MTERENFLEMLSGGRPEWLPLDVWVTEPALDMIEAHLGTRDEIAALGVCVQNVAAEFPSEDRKWREAYANLGFPIPETAEIGFAGLVHDVPPAHSVGAAYHFREMLHPLSTVTDVAQLEALPFPDVADDRYYATVPAQVERIHQKGVAAVGQMHCTVFELSWYLRGMDALYLDLIDATGIADWLLDWFTHRAVEAVKRYCRAGVDCVFFGDDVGTQRGMMMAVPFWREHLKPRLARCIRAVREHESKHTWVIYHSDGDVREVLEDLIEIGVEVLNPMQPECMPVGELIPAYKDRLGFWGMIGTQTTMPFGTPDDVRRVVGELRDFARQGARVVVAPTHVIEPDVPWENLEALVAEVKRPLR